MSQRVIERGPRLTCTSFGLKYDRMDKKITSSSRSPRFTLSFNDTDEDASIFADFIDNGIVPLTDLKGQKYFFDIENLKGKLKFKLIRLNDGAVLGEVNTVNSMKQIRLVYTNLGQGAYMECLPSKDAL